MTSEVAYDLGFNLLDLENLCSHVSMVVNCYRSQDISSCHLLHLPLKPCQDGPLTSRASLGSKNPYCPHKLNTDLSVALNSFRQFLLCGRGDLPGGRADRGSQSRPPLRLRLLRRCAGTQETASKVVICPRGTLLYMQIYTQYGL